jgi:hypothetical protein
MDQYGAVHNFHLKRWDLFLEWSWGCSILRTVLITVPGTSDTPVENTPFTERSILVLTNIRDGRHLAVILEHRDTLA